ncbi:MAG: VanZ family protein [Phycisphaerae bacterium]|jgi:VanZ family protein
MSRKRAYQPPQRLSWVHSSRLHVVLYSLLLLATPFILLRSFLVEAIGAASGTTVPLAGHNIPIVPVLALLIVIGLAIALHAYITWRRLAATVAALLMIALAQQITDYYFDHKFYDLQQNWHYFAYGLFAFMMYRDLAPRGVSPAHIMLITYIAAMLYSTLDEAFQMHMSSRVFDVSDIAKDVWGTLMGLVVLLFGNPPASDAPADARRLRHPRLGDYVRHPASLLVLLIALTLLLLINASLLSDFEHWPIVIAFTAAMFAVFFAVLHFSQHRRIGRVLLAACLVIVAVQAFFYIRHRGDNIVHSSFGLTVYKGIPIPYYDVLIFPDGSFRPVDKKHDFNYRDQAFLLRREPDIILIGAGHEGRGGYGFPERAANQFIFNRYTGRATQVIILNTPEACQVFNRLKREGKRVLFVLHSTC